MSRLARGGIAGQPGERPHALPGGLVRPAALREELGEDELRGKDVDPTNAVKHFKWRPKGTRRIHDTPDWTEVSAPSWRRISSSRAPSADRHGQVSKSQRMGS